MSEATVAQKPEAVEDVDAVTGDEKKTPVSSRTYTYLATINIARR